MAAVNKSKNSVLNEYLKKDKKSGDVEHVTTAAPSQNATRLQLRQANIGNAYKRNIDLNIFVEYHHKVLRVISSDELITIWKHYDRKELGFLQIKSKEWETLSTHIVERIEQMFYEDYSAKMKTDNNISDDEQVDKLARNALESERPYLLPGSGTTHDKNVRDMIVFLFKNMDLNRDGKVTKQEFANSWHNFMPKFFTMKTENPSKSCTIL